jgi:internalin A
MTDLERIEEIEKIIGFKLERVEPENFDFYGNKCTRRYSVDGYGFVTMLSLFKVPTNLLPPELIVGFKNIRFLSLESCSKIEPKMILINSNLVGLNLSDTTYINYSHLKTLKKLTSLNLSRNFLNNTNFLKCLKDLKNLSYLDIRDNEIDSLTFLKDIQQIKILKLDKNNVKDISILKELKNLEKLFLKDNRVCDVGPLCDSSNLEVLDMSANDIFDVAPLENLKKLKQLFLNDNRIKNINKLKELKDLTCLQLSRNSISDICPLEDLHGIEMLYLSSNKIKDISFLKKLNNLVSLDLHNNQIEDISILQELKNIKAIDLSSNLVKKIPEKVYNKGIEINFFEGFRRFEDCFNLHSNPIQTPPTEIVKQGNNAIHQWYGANRKKLNEIKVLFVGEAKAGKTSLMHRLLDNSFNPLESQTDGIHIEDFKFDELETFQNQTQLHGITAYFWDFGGQEIMSSTHQFFMTKRSLYLLVLEARKDEKSDEQVRNWMRRIKAFGGDSQVIIVVNKIDQNRAFCLDEYTLGKEFPQIKEYLYVSCSTPENIDSVKIALEQYIPKTELFNTEIDERWFPIKDELRKRTAKESYLPEREFEKICRENGLDEKSEQLSAVWFLNDLGIILHFDNLMLGEFYVLDPYWVTSGVYRIITSDTAAQQNGSVDVEQLRIIVNETRNTPHTDVSVSQRHITYSTGEVKYIADIMAEFKLCYYMDQGQKILIPDLLDKNTPATESEPFYNEIDSISMVYNYEYLPNGILPRFIVEMRKDIHNVWRTGVILHCSGCFNAQALVCTSENRLHIIVTGEHKQKRGYLSAIRYLINTINKDYTVTTSVQIPLPGTDNLTVEYEELLAMEQAGQRKYVLYKIKKEWEISSLLDGIAPDEEVQKIALPTIINNYYGTNTSTPHIQQEQKSKAPRTVKIFLASSNELKTHREQFEIFINRQNKQYMGNQELFLQLELWEDFIDAMDKNRLQDAYNRTIKECEIFIMLYWTKVGMYTAEEFDVAFGQFKENNSPMVYTYEYTEPVPNDKLNRKETNSLFDFRDTLKELGHFTTQYKSIEDLQYQFSSQLQKILGKIVAG